VDWEERVPDFSPMRELLRGNFSFPSWLRIVVVLAVAIANCRNKTSVIT
jgi:hypothetical protein